MKNLSCAFSPNFSILTCSPQFYIYFQFNFHCDNFFPPSLVCVLSCSFVFCPGLHHVLAVRTFRTECEDIFYSKCRCWQWNQNGQFPEVCKSMRHFFIIFWIKRDVLFCATLIELTVGMCQWINWDFWGIIWRVVVEY